MSNIKYMQEKRQIFTETFQTMYVNTPTFGAGVGGREDLNLFLSLPHVKARLRDLLPKTERRKGKIIGSHGGNLANTTLTK